ncbi:hypothetical protein [Leptolyngbya sp. 7M]|uniref:hypothetical protein n=1 Tax=Leptolyngbya sp. 7M TaxID=2812896 RepID=UPI001B8C5F73|nr:hypothetical protein [Leptolyngbya sp. 7M]QYO63430.1 hypothetical protein JVX88_26555 [Leptolyngbya sp. 7M]
MTNYTTTMSMYHRILAIDWRRKTCTDSDFYIDLMAEYLRRSALWAKVLAPSHPIRPFSDIAASVDPTIRADSDLVKALLDYLNQFPVNATEKRVCEQALHWAVIDNMPQVKQFALPDPYEPLLVLFEQGGTFRTEHGWIDVAGGGFQMRNWHDYAEKPPFVELNK